MTNWKSFITLTLGLHLCRNIETSLFGWVGYYFGATTFNLKTLKMLTFGIITLSLTIKTRCNDTRCWVSRFHCYAECRYTGRCYAKCNGAIDRAQIVLQFHSKSQNQISIEYLIDILVMEKYWKNFKMILGTFAVVSILVSTL